MYLFLEVSKVCEDASLLRVLYFALIFKDIIFTVVPIGLVLMLIIDFSKAVIANKEDVQSKSMKLVTTRIMYAVIIFMIPWFVDLLMNILSSADLKIGDDYNECITKARKGNFEQYEEPEETSPGGTSSVGNNPFNSTHFAQYRSSFNSSTFAFIRDPSAIDNLMQKDYSEYPKYKVCGNLYTNGKPRTISTSGCGYMSFTMVARSLGYLNTEPDQIVSIACDEYGYNDSAASKGFLMSDTLNNHFGFKVEDILKAYPSKAKFIPAVEEALRNGKKIIILIPGHYISIIGINSDGTIVARDSARGFVSSSTKTYTVESLYNATYYSGGKENCEKKGNCGWTMILAYSKK